MFIQRTKTRQLTLAATFAAVYFVLRSIPTFQMVGISGRFTAGDFLVTTIALVAGTWPGALAVIVGTILAYAVRPPLLLGLDFLPALANILLVTMIVSKRITMARVLYLTTLAVFLVSPYSLLFAYGPVPYAWLHIAGFALLASPLAKRLPEWLAKSGYWQVAAVALLAYLGTMLQHLTGGLLYELTVGFLGGLNPAQFQEFWRVIFWVYPAERLLIVVVSTFIGLAVYKSAKRLAL